MQRISQLRAANVLGGPRVAFGAQLPASPVVSLTAGLTRAELQALCRWVETCHARSASKSQIKDEGLIQLALRQGEPEVVDIRSEAGVSPDLDVQTALQKVVTCFLRQLRQHFPEQYQMAVMEKQRLQFNVLSYKPAHAGQDWIAGVPFHQDRSPTTILFNVLLQAPRMGGEFEVKHLETGDSHFLRDVNQAMLFDDRDCVHRVGDMRGERKALTLRVW